MTHRVTVVIPWKDRSELEATLRLNASFFRQANAKVLIVNCGGNIVNLLQLTGRTMLGIDLVDIVNAPFNRSLALNIGSHYSTTDVLWLLDCDIVIDYASFLKCFDCVAQGGAATLERLNESIDDSTRYYLSGTHVSEIVSSQLTEVIWADGSTTAVRNHGFYIGSGSRGGQGQLMIQRQHLMSIGGYNSALTGWGFEDIDILIRMQRLLSIPHKQFGEALHLSHGDASRNIVGPSRRHNNIKNTHIAYSNYAQGKLDGTMAMDITSWSQHLRLYGATGAS